MVHSSQFCLGTAWGSCQSALLPGVQQVPRHQLALHWKAAADRRTREDRSEQDRISQVRAFRQQQHICMSGATLCRPRLASLAPDMHNCCFDNMQRCRQSCICVAAAAAADYAYLSLTPNIRMRRWLNSRQPPMCPEVSAWFLICQQDITDHIECDTIQQPAPKVTWLYQQ